MCLESEMFTSTWDLGTLIVRVLSGASRTNDRSIILVVALVFISQLLHNYTGTRPTGSLAARPAARHRAT